MSGDGIPACTVRPCDAVLGDGAGAAVTNANLPDRWLTDPVYRQLSPVAWSLFTLGLIWSMRQESDGMIPAGALPMITPPSTTRRGVEKGVEELLVAGLWSRDGDGWQVEDWGKSQTTSAQMRRTRERWRDKKRETRQDSEKNSSEESAESRAETADVQGGIPRESRASRSNALVKAEDDVGVEGAQPLRSHGADGEPSAAGSPVPSEPRSKFAPIPASWAPNDEHRVIAAERYLDLDEQARRFRAWAISSARELANWDEKFVKWMLDELPGERPVGAELEWQQNR